MVVPRLSVQRQADRAVIRPRHVGVNLGGGEARARFLATTGQERMWALAAICAQHGADWRKRVAPPETTAPDWYFSYGEFGD